MGRKVQFEFTPAIAEHICARLVERESLRSICKGDGMPSAGTVCAWLGQHQEFAEQYAKAREAQADALFDDILYIADNPQTGVMTKTLPNGGVEITEREMIEHRRLQIDARKWLAGKLRPKKYGERTEQIHSGPEGSPIQHNLIYSGILAEDDKNA